MLVTNAVLDRWLRASMILYHRLAACGQIGTFDAIEAKLVDDQEGELGIEAHAVVDGLVGQRRGQVFEQLAAGDVTHPLFEHARCQANTLDQSAFSQAALPHKNDVLFAADEVALGQRLDLQRGMAGLKFQSKVSSGSASRK